MLSAMEAVGRNLALAGHTLRSGAAPGADSAFEWGAVSKGGSVEIYLPYKGFKAHNSELYGSTLETRKMASLFHPNWANVGCAGREFMGRNCYQVLGPNLNDPVEFVICWTPKGKIVGGTGQALRMAIHYHIPIFNLGSLTFDEANDKISEILN
jgi:hypothetical protein